MTIRIYFSDHEICFNVKVSILQLDANAEWRLGTCNNIGIEYENYKEYIQRCCLKPGEYTLTCMNKQSPNGWGPGYIEIQGQRYCDDFMSFKLMQKISIRSKINEDFNCYNVLKVTTYNLVIQVD